MKRYTMIIFSFLICETLVAQNCENVIALSKLKNTVVKNNDSVKSHATNFCSEYAKTSGKNSTNNFGASYKFLSATFNSGKASLEEVASKYCSASNIYQASNDAYEQYIESIAPGAYSAYEDCIKMSTQDLKFNVNQASVLPKEFSVSIQFISSNHRPQAVLIYSASDDVTCKWEGVTNDVQNVLKTGGTGILKCKRTKQDVRSYVTIADTQTGTGGSLTIPWQRYDKKGNPISAIDTLKAQINAISNDVKENENRLMNLTLSCSKFEEKSGAVSSGPVEVVVSIPAEYTLTGGGCNSSNPAWRKIVENYPSSNSWHCKTQDHQVGKPGSVTAYAIGCKPN